MNEKKLEDHKLETGPMEKSTEGIQVGFLP